MVVLKLCPWQANEFPIKRPKQIKKRSMEPKERDQISKLIEVVRSLCFLIGFTCCNAFVSIFKQNCKIELLVLLIAKS